MEGVLKIIVYPHKYSSFFSKRSRKVNSIIRTNKKFSAVVLILISLLFKQYLCQPKFNNISIQSLIR